VLGIYIIIKKITVVLGLKNWVVTPSVSIGYLICQKAYKLFDLLTKKIFTSRDV
jgi:hypothetical protein